jgi:hypothetical protein
MDDAQTDHGFAWKKLDKHQHLVAAGKTFRVRSTVSDDKFDTAYVYLELLTTRGWIMLEECCLGEAYYGYCKNPEAEGRRLKGYAEGLVTIGATLSEVPRRKSRS